MRGRRAVPAAAVLVLALIAAGVLIARGAGGRSGVSGNAGYPPVVRFTGKPPTGYTVTFRYRDPSAHTVEIQGEWYFSSPAYTTIGASEGLPPSHWKPGDFAINPNAPADINAGLKSTWPNESMEKNPRTGVWSYTTPLPSGVFSYGFVVNCTSRLTPAELANPSVPSSYTGCPEIADPSNPPWNARDGVTHGSVVTYSQVYVPSDAAFHTVNYWWEAPTSPAGALTDVTYHGTDGPPNLPGKNYLAIYTPPGYNSHRAKPYPTLYLSHGYDNNEIDWCTGGDAANILDELIDKHVIKPIVVVMPNAWWEAPPDPAPSGATEYDQNLLGTIIPYIQSHYDVSKQPSQRAFAGLSYGGYVAGSLLVDHTSDFGYFGLMSPAPFTLSALGTAQADAIKHVHIMVGGGLDDGAHSFALMDTAALRRAGRKVFTDFVNGGHDWFVWRVLLRDFLTRVAFKPV